MRDDDAHRVVEIRLAHLVLELDADDAVVLWLVDHVLPCSVLCSSAATAARTRANVSSVREYRRSSSRFLSSGIRRKIPSASASTAPSLARDIVPCVSIERLR